MKSYSVIKFLIVALVAVSLGACAGGSSSSDDSGSGSSSGGGTGSGFTSSLLGTWKSVCMDVGDDVYVVITINYKSGGQATDIVVFYSDSGCASPTGLRKDNQTSYSIGNSVTASGKSAYEVDTTINSWTLTQDGAEITSGSNLPTQYSIAAIEGDTLYLGLNRDPIPITSASDRPTVLDLEYYYTRQ